MTNKQWMHMYLQAWMCVHDPRDVNNFKHGVKFMWWDYMWTVPFDGCGPILVKWNPPVDGYTYIE